MRLGSICRLLNADKLKGPKYNYLQAKYLRGKSEAVIKDEGRFVKKGTKVILVDGENSGEVFTIPEDGYMGSTFRVLYIPSLLDEEYVLKLIELYKEPLRKSKKGAAIPHLNKEIFNNIFIGIPPINEQKRIIEQIKYLMPFVEKYGGLKEELDEFNKDMDRQFYELNEKYHISCFELEYEDVNLDTFIERLDLQIKLINIK